MKKNYLLLLLLMTSFAYAQVSQGFENVAGMNFIGANTCNYQDLDSTTTHDLVNYTNSCGTVYVSEADSGSFMGYTINYVSTGSVGFSDADSFGVASASGLNINMPGVTPTEGTQVFLMEDTDATITMRLGIVNLTGTTSPMASLQYYIDSTTWEISDIFRVYINVTDCASATTVTLIDTIGLDIDTLGIEGAWNTLSTNLTAYVGCKAQMFIEFASNSASEELAIDNIQFTEGSLDSTLSTAAFETESLFTFAPNPVNDILTLNAQANISSVKVYNMLGQNVLSVNPNTRSNEVNMSNLKAGIYLVQVKIGNTQETIKVIKK